MPEQAIAPAPAPNPSPVPPPTPSPAPPAPSPVGSVQPAKEGIDALMSPFTPKPPEPATPAAADTEDPKKESDAIPPKPVEDIWEKAPPRYKNAFHKEKRLFEEKLSGVQAKIKELESKPVQNQETLDKIKALEERASNLQKQLDEREGLLVEADYSRSKEFNERHVVPINNYYKRAVDEVKTLTINDGESERKATKQDFDYVMSLSADPSRQDAVIEEMFGKSARRVWQHINELNRMQTNADEAVANAAKSSTEKRASAQKQIETSEREYQEKTQTVRAQIQKDYPQFFGEIEGNKEANDSFQQGLKVWDDNVSNSKNLSPAQLAERFELLRHWAGFFPRSVILLNQKDAQIKSLQEELGKYRKSDPGSAPARPAPATTPSTKSGIEAILEGAGQ